MKDVVEVVNDCRRMIAMLAGLLDSMSLESDSYVLSGVAVCLNRIDGDLGEVELSMEL